MSISATASPLLDSPQNAATNEDSCEMKCLEDNLNDSVAMIKCNMDCKVMPMDLILAETNKSDRDLSFCDIFPGGLCDL